MNELAVSGLVSILLSLLGIVLAWWALQSIRWELFVHDMKAAPFRLLMILLSLALGHAFARFIMDYLAWSNMLSNLF